MEPLFAPLDRVYLNAAGRSPLPLPSLAAGLAAAQRKAHSPWDIGDTSADLDTGSGTSSTTQHYARALGGHDGCDNDDAGHVLAHQLGGCGSCPTNIVPQSPHLNRGVWEQFEAAIRDCIDAGASATLSWKFDYDSTSAERPSTMSYAAKYIGGSCDDASRDFDNACTDADAR